MSSKKAMFDTSSNNSNMSAGKSRKIGGFARRRAARESVRNLLDYKKNYSVLEQSMRDS